MKRRTITKLLLTISISMLWSGAKAQEELHLNLDKAIEIALAVNPTIKVADKEVQLKQMANKEAWQTLLPTAEIVGTGSYTVKAPVMRLGNSSFKMGSDNTTTMNGALTVSLPIFAPAVYRTMKMTKTDIELALEQGRSSRLELINQVTKAYYQLILAQDTYDQLHENYEQSERNYNVVKAKFEQGRASEYEKLSAEVQMRNSWPGVVSAKNAIRMAGLQLKVLMGITLELDLVIDDKLEHYHDQVAIQLATVDEQTVQKNSTIRQFDFNEKLLGHNLKLIKTNLLPTLSLAYNFQYQTLNNPTLAFWSYDWSPASTVGVTLSIPLYKASNFTKMKSIRIQQEQLAENRINTERQLRMSAQLYLDNMTASAEQLESNRLAIEAARKELMISEKRYEVGKGTILELNSAQVGLTQSMLSYSNSIYNYLTAKSDYENICGTHDAKISVK